MFSIETVDLLDIIDSEGACRGLDISVYIYSMFVYKRRYINNCFISIDPHRGILSDILSGIQSDIFPDILSCILSDFLSGILSDIYSGILSGVLF